MAWLPEGGALTPPFPPPRKVMPADPLIPWETGV